MNSVKSIIYKFLSEGGLNNGDKVLLHSNISKLYKRLIEENFKSNVEDILNIIIDYIGPSGTLVIPTFNFDFCDGKTYNFLKSKSQMGALSEAARVKAQYNKSWHPVYSFVFFGNIPFEELKKENYTAFGKDSVFEWITAEDGKISIIDLPDQNSMTYYHYVEEKNKVSWRYQKKFEGEYIFADKSRKKIIAEIFVRNLNPEIITKVRKMEKILWEKKLYKSKFPFTNIGCRSIRARDVKTETEKIIFSGNAKGILYDIK